MYVYDVKKLYDKESYRNFQVVTLNREAAKVFMDSVTIPHYQELLEERDKIKDAKLEDIFDITPFTQEVLDNYILEFTKLGLACEITIKAKLLYKNFLVHTIDKSFDKEMRKKQEKAPITVKEYNEKHPEDNYRHVTRYSIGFSSILKDEYIKVLEIDDETVCTLKMIEDARNVIHFPINLAAGTNLSSKTLNCLIKIYNEILVNTSNKIIDDCGFNYKKMKNI